MLNQEGGALYLGNGVDGDILFGSLLFYSFRASCFVSGLCFHVVPVVTRCLHQGPRTLWRQHVWPSHSHCFGIVHIPPGDGGGEGGDMITEA